MKWQSVFAIVPARELFRKPKGTLYGNKSAN
jgi:hypothetical protein